MPPPDIRSCPFEAGIYDHDGIHTPFISPRRGGDPYPLFPPCSEVCSQNFEFNIRFSRIDEAGCAFQIVRQPARGAQYVSALYSLDLWSFGSGSVENEQG
jgi:hypothetical protein